MEKVKNHLDADTASLHETMRKYFTPGDDLILIEYVENLKTAGGVYLAKEQKSMMHPIVAVGENVKRYVSGEFIMFKNIDLDVFECFGRKWSIVEVYKIACKVVPTYIIEEQKYNQEAEKVKLAKLAEVKKSTIIN